MQPNLAATAESLPDLGAPEGSDGQSGPVDLSAEPIGQPHLRQVTSLTQALAAPVRVSAPVAQTAVEQPSNQGPIEKVIASLDRETTVFIPASATFKGEIVAKAIVVSGQFNGKAHATDGPLIVTQTAVFTGSALGEHEVIVAGQYEGDGDEALRAKGKLLLTESARVKSNIAYNTIAIYEGAEIDGTIKPLRK